MARRADVRMLRDMRGGAAPTLAAAKSRSDAILDKMNSIKRFVKDQRTKVTASSSKHEWMLARRRLHEEAELAERELESSFSEESLACVREVAECAQLRVDLEREGQAAVEQSLAETHILINLARGVISEVRSLAGGGHASDGDGPGQARADVPGKRSSARASASKRRPTSTDGSQAGASSGDAARRALAARLADDDVAMLRAELAFACSEMRGRCDALAAQADALGVEIKREWPTALSAGTGAHALPGHEAGRRGELDQCGSAELVEDLLDRFPQVDDATAQEVRVAFANLDATYRAKAEACKAAGVAASDASEGKFPPWSAKEVEMFALMRKDCLAQALTTPGRDPKRSLVEAMSRFLQGRSEADILAHEERYVLQRTFQDKRRGVVEAWERERGALLRRSEKLLADSVAAAIARGRDAAQALEWEVARENLRAELEEMREEKDVMAIVEAERTAAMDKVAAKKAKAEAEQRQEVERQKKALIAEYRAELAAAAEEAARLQAIVDEKKREDDAILARFNEERVAYRRTEEAEKAKERAEKKAAERAAEEEKEARLAQLRAQVAVIVEADPERVRAPTESLLASAEATEAETPFNKVYGYTTEEVLKDHRFRLQEALRSAGIHNTEGGRMAVVEAVWKAKPYKPPRVDQFPSELRSIVMKQRLEG